jgi:hypothetical protein
MSQTQNYLLTDNIAINDELLCKICNYAHGHGENIFDVNNYSSYLFKEISSTIKKRLISVHLLLIYYNQKEYWDFNDGQLKWKVGSFLGTDEFVIDNFDINQKTNKKPDAKDVFDAVESKLKNIHSTINAIRKEIDSIPALINNRNKFLKIFAKIPSFILENTEKDSKYDKIFLESFFKRMDEFESLDIGEKIAKSDQLIQYIERNIYINFRSSLFNEEIIYILENTVTFIKDIREIQSDYVSTELELNFDDRRYSLEKNKNIEFGIDIYNKGNTTAKNVEILADELEADGGFEFTNPVDYLFDIPPNDLKRVSYKGKCNVDYDRLPILFKYSWINPNNTKMDDEVLHDFIAQSKDVDWEELKKLRPYRDKIIKNKEELFGRDSQIDFMVNSLTSLENYFVYGQKRIGKTSFATVLAEKLKEGHINVFFADTGAFDLSNGLTEFINQLGGKIIEYFERSLNKPIPSEDYNFKGSIHLLVDYFKKLFEDKPEEKFVIIFDEFDNLFHLFIKNEHLGDSFFQSIRSISQLENVAFVFVGGENIDLIKKLSSVKHLNRFDDLKLDYIEELFISDYYKIITKQKGLEVVTFEKDALEEIYRLTCGNPYFTKILCGNIWKLIIENRNLHVGIREVGTALNVTLESSGLQAWEHFWTDRMPVKDKKTKLDITISRRNYLRYFASLKRNIKTKQVEDLTVKKEFLDRNILNDSEGLSMRPKIFEEWLIQYGANQLDTTYHEDLALEENEIRENDYFVKDCEIDKIVDNFVGYQNKTIDKQSIQKWLTNFKNNTEKRVFFNLLKEVNYIHKGQVRGKLKYLYTEACKGTTWVVPSNDKDLKAGTDWSFKKEQKVARSRDDVLVSTLDDLHKSGSYLLKDLVAATNLIGKNIVNFNELEKPLLEKCNIIIFIDDIIGSGDQMKLKIEKKLIHNKELSDYIKDGNKRIVILSILANEDEVKKINDKYEDQHIKIIYHDSFNKNDNYFEKIKNNKSHIENETNIIKEYCNKLEKKEPYGYGNLGLLIVFAHNCPNNSLPVLYKQAKDFTPLFTRVG